jgi:hypothetical protein
VVGIRPFNVHRTWEDYLGIGLGVLIALSPWLAGQQDDQTVIGNAIIVGVLVCALAQLELASLHRWEEAGELACGLWLMASPLTFGYAESGALRYWDFTLGTIVALLAVLELWQDWKLSNKKLDQHGL